MALTFERQGPFKRKTSLSLQEQMRTQMQPQMQPQLFLGQSDSTCP